DVTMTATAGDVLIGNDHTATSIIASTGNASFEAGNTLHMWDTASIAAAKEITFRVDTPTPTLRPSINELIEGTVTADLISVFGSSSADSIDYTPVAIAGHTQIWGGNGEDYILVDKLPSIDCGHKFQNVPAGAQQACTSTTGGPNS